MIGFHAISCSNLRLDFLIFTYFWFLLEEQWLETLLYEEQQNPFPSPLPSAAKNIMEVLSVWLHSYNVTYRCLWYCHHHRRNGHLLRRSQKTAVTSVLADLPSLFSHNHCTSEHMAGQSGNHSTALLLMAPVLCEFSVYQVIQPTYNTVPIIKLQIWAP